MALTLLGHTIAGSVALTPVTTAGSGRLRLYYCASPLVGSGHTFTATPATTSYPTVAVLAWSGSRASPFDVENGTTGGFQPGAVTPSSAPALIVQGLCCTDTNPASINGGYTITDQLIHGPGAHFGCALAYLVQDTAVATNPTWTTALPGPAAAVFLAAPASAATRAPSIGGGYYP